MAPEVSYSGVIRGGYLALLAPGEGESPEDLEGLLPYRSLLRLPPVTPPEAAALCEAVTLFFKPYRRAPYSLNRDLFFRGGDQRLPAEGLAQVLTLTEDPLLRGLLLLGTPWDALEGHALLTQASPAFLEEAVAALALLLTPLLRRHRAPAEAPRGVVRPDFPLPLALGLAALTLGDLRTLKPRGERAEEVLTVLHRHPLSPGAGRRGAAGALEDPHPLPLTPQGVLSLLTDPRWDPYPLGWVLPLLPR